MMPYQVYMLYQIERPKSPAEIRRADDQRGKAAKSMSALWRRAAEPIGQAARRRTSQTVAAMSSTDSASSQPPSIHWKGQNRLPG